VIGLDLERSKFLATALALLRLVSQMLLLALCNNRSVQ
jgi:hypothetical protein